MIVHKPLLPVKEYDAACAARWPDIPWRQPQQITFTFGDKLGCRLCIARYGLKAAEAQLIPYLFDTIEQFTRHRGKVHDQAE